jgi:hypothetical protein
VGGGGLGDRALIFIYSRAPLIYPITKHLLCAAWVANTSTSVDHLTVSPTTGDNHPTTATSNVTSEDHPATEIAEGHLATATCEDHPTTVIDENYSTAATGEPTIASITCEDHSTTVPENPDDRA